MKLMEKDIEKFKKQIFKGPVNIVEWTGTTKRVDFHDFHWPDYVAGDLSESKMLRFSLKGTNDSYLALAEEKDHNAKKITVQLGGWDDNHSVMYWQ